MDNNVDIVIIISSYDRYEWLYNILTKIYANDTRYSFKVIVYNDGSTDIRYHSLNTLFPTTIFLESKINNGRVFYWKSINSLFTEARKYQFKYLIQIDDDFDLCDNFINVLLDEHITAHRLNQKIIATHYVRNKPSRQWHLDNWIDGGFILCSSFLEKINYTIPQRNPGRHGGSSGVWRYVTDRINKAGYKVHFPSDILITHLGHTESKMHVNHRAKCPIFIEKTKK
jgi:GT2 family glycosyltransferase